MKSANELIESEIPLQTRILLPKIFQRAYQAADLLVAENKILQCPSAQIGHLRAWASDTALEYQSLSFIHIGMPNPESSGAAWLGITKNILDEIYIVSSDTAPIEAQDIKPVVTIKEAIKEKIAKHGN